MSVWDSYENRMTVRGMTKHDTSLKREKRMLLNKVPDNLSYQEVGIDCCCGECCRMNVSIINSDNLNEKYLYTMPGEDIDAGSLVDWMGHKWLVTERDANSTVYIRAKLVQCNYLLKWVSSDGFIREQWCVVDDGTKYMTGEYEDRNFIVTRGDARVSMTIGRNKLTAAFNRESRFFIDDPLSETKLVFQLTKPLKVGNVYNDTGVFIFTLSESYSTDDDCIDLGITDYYKYYPEERNSYNVEEHIDHPTDENGRKRWF